MEGDSVLADGHAGEKRLATSVESQQVAARAVGDPVDEATFLHVYQATLHPLRRFAARVLADSGQADDVVQETYLRFLRRPPPTDDVREIRAYLFRIAANLVIDHQRRRRREVTLDEAPPPPAGTRDGALRLDVQQVFAQLKPRERQLVWLAHVEGADHREIASMLGLRELSVRVLLWRARRKLAKLLRERGLTSRSTDRGDL